MPYRLIFAIGVLVVITLCSDSLVAEERKMGKEHNADRYITAVCEFADNVLRRGKDVWMARSGRRGVVSANLHNHRPASVSQGLA